MSNSVMASCCACGDVSKVLATRGDAVELVRGLAYIGRGKWICAGCTRTATSEFSRAMRQKMIDEAQLEEPPPGFV